MNAWKCPWISSMTTCAITDKISQSEFCLNDLFVEGDKHGVSVCFYHLHSPTFQFVSPSSLSSLLSLFLPLSLSTWSGVPEVRMADEKQWFDEFKLQRVSDGKPLPQGDGVLIFNEVKAVCRLMWNSWCQKIIGLAMSPDDLASVQDIYQLIESDAKTQQTSCIMQFLWWDLTSGFFIVVPYITSSKTFENKTKQVY